jgi:L-ascorbate metabolism protein UlaG (beta-lactamase superfamily)
MRRSGRVQARWVAATSGLAASLLLGAGVSSAGPDHVDLTWLSISNVHHEIGGLRVLADGYITRLPQSAFFGGGGGLKETQQPFVPDVPAVTRVMQALGGPSSVTLLLTGHSHFDHSFDTATWSKLTGAPIIGSRTTCFQAQAEDLPASRCRAVEGGEAIALAEGVTMHVVRWNHSGDTAVNPEQHDPVELAAPPMRDEKSGGLRAGVAEDFPNGGGGRGFLFVVDGPDGRFSWFYQNSASAVDLHVPIVEGTRDFGAPLVNLQAAMAAAKLESVDLWVGSRGVAVAQLVVPVLKPKAYIPIHWDGLWGAFEKGVPEPFADPELERYMAASGVRVVKPVQYMDKWRLDRSGIRPVPNDAVKKALGF